MRLPYSTELGYFNHLLTTAIALSEGQESCAIPLLINSCKARIFDGRYIDYSDILHLAAGAELIEIEDKRLRVTRFGRLFLDQNPDSYFDLSPAQKVFVSRQLILDGPWQEFAKNVFSFFIPNYNEITFEFPISEVATLDLETQATLHLFWVLDLLIKQGEVFRVNPIYVKHVNSVRFDPQVISQTELEDAINQNRTLAFKAEEVIVEFERNRLRSLGRISEAERVIRVSDLQANAGYDIKSFDGDKPSVEYDRFIEVKSSSNANINFHWSINQIEIARLLSNQYWIYFVGEFNEYKNASDINPFIFQDPFHSIRENEAFDVTPSEFKVTQVIKIQ